MSETHQRQAQGAHAQKRVTLVVRETHVAPPEVHLPIGGLLTLVVDPSCRSLSLQSFELLGSDGETLDVTPQLLPGQAYSREMSHAGTVEVASCVYPFLRSRVHVVTSLPTRGASRRGAMGGILARAPSRGALSNNSDVSIASTSSTSSGSSRHGGCLPKRSGSSIELRPTPIVPVAQRSNSSQELRPSGRSSPSSRHQNGSGSGKYNNNNNGSSGRQSSAHPPCNPCRMCKRMFVSKINAKRCLSSHVAENKGAQQLQPVERADLEAFWAALDSVAAAQLLDLRSHSGSAAVLDAYVTACVRDNANNSQLQRYASAGLLLRELATRGVEKSHLPKMSADKLFGLLEAGSEGTLLWPPTPLIASSEMVTYPNNEAGLALLVEQCLVDAYRQLHQHKTGEEEGKEAEDQGAPATPSPSAVQTTTAKIDDDQRQGPVAASPAGGRLEEDREEGSAAVSTASAVAEASELEQQQQEEEEASGRVSKAAAGKSAMAAAAAVAGRASRAKAAAAAAVQCPVGAAASRTCAEGGDDGGAVAVGQRVLGQAGATAARTYHKFDFLAALSRAIGAAEEQETAAGGRGGSGGGGVTHMPLQGGVQPLQQQQRGSVIIGSSSSSCFDAVAAHRELRRRWLQAAAGQQPQAQQVFSRGAGRGGNKQCREGSEHDENSVCGTGVVVHVTARAGPGVAAGGHQLPRGGAKPLAAGSRR